ncbi:MAG: hypothetical protein JXR83_18720 [Deltaproteobacteria bacterium]|nr:hypothetical protein [Deltaproteobacteria bacterium]
MLTRDYMMRIIKELAKLLKVAFRLKDEQRYQQALDEVNRGYRELLAIDPGMLDSMDAASAAKVIGEVARVRVVVELVLAEADIAAAMGDASRASTRHRNALEVLVEGIWLSADCTEDDLELLERVVALVPVEAVAKRYRDFLVEIGLAA